jgi:nucleoporin NUP2
VGASQETDKAGTTDDSSGSAGMLFGNDTPTGLDAEGEGEEDEETVQTARIKAFRMRKKEEGGDGGWLDIGIGALPFFDIRHEV